MTGVVFLHGWGFGPSTWDGWTGAFGNIPVAVLDAGYFGPARLDLPLALGGSAAGWVGVGHSQGFARLAGLDLPWRGLVGLGAFLHFCPTPAHPAGTPPETMDAMLARMDLDPVDVLARFRRRCGLKDFPAPAPSAEGLPRLRADLAALRSLDMPGAPDCPTLLLHAADDRIAPVELGREAARRIPASRLVELESGGHGLPVTRAELCLAQVLEFLHGLA